MIGAGERCAQPAQPERGAKNPLASGEARIAAER
jgi:hypothetical protein